MLLLRVAQSGCFGAVEVGGAKVGGGGVSPLPPLVILIIKKLVVLAYHQLRKEVKNRRLRGNLVLGWMRRLWVNFEGSREDLRSRCLVDCD